MGMWPHCGAGTSTQCCSAASRCVRGSWHRVSATAPAAPSMGHRVLPPVPLLSFSKSFSVLPLLVVPPHLPPRSCLPPVSRVPRRFSQLQDSVLLTFHLLSFTIILKHHSLSSFDGICFLGKHFTFSVTALNIPFSCISCFILSHPLTFQYVIAAVASPNAAMVYRIQFSESAFASFFQWSQCAHSTGQPLPKWLLSVISLFSQEDKPSPCFFVLPCSLQTASSSWWLCDMAA